MSGFLRKRKCCCGGPPGPYCGCAIPNSCGVKACDDKSQIFPIRAVINFTGSDTSQVVSTNLPGTNPGGSYPTIPDCVTLTQTIIDSWTSGSMTVQPVSGESITAGTNACRVREVGYYYRVLGPDGQTYEFDGLNPDMPRRTLGNSATITRLPAATTGFTIPPDNPYYQAPGTQLDEYWKTHQIKSLLVDQYVVEATATVGTNNTSGVNSASLKIRGDGFSSNLIEIHHTDKHTWTPLGGSPDSYDRYWQRNTGSPGSSPTYSIADTPDPTNTATATASRTGVHACCSVEAPTPITNSGAVNATSMTIRAARPTDPGSFSAPRWIRVTIDISRHKQWDGSGGYVANRFQAEFIMRQVTAGGLGGAAAAQWLTGAEYRFFRLVSSNTTFANVYGTGSGFKLTRLSRNLWYFGSSTSISGNPPLLNALNQTNIELPVKWSGASPVGMTDILKCVAVEQPGNGYAPYYDFASSRTVIYPASISVEETASEDCDLWQCGTTNAGECCSGFATIAAYAAGRSSSYVSLTRTSRSPCAYSGSQSGSGYTRSASVSWDAANNRLVATYANNDSTGTMSITATMAWPGLYSTRYSGQYQIQSYTGTGAYASQPAYLQVG